MNHRRLIAGVPLLAIALACYPGSPASRAAPKAEGANSITSTSDTAKEGTIKASGEFTTVRGVTLTKVVVWAYPASSGVLPAPAELTERDIDDKKKTWGPAAITTRVYAGRYAVRADGYFSDGTSVSSAYEVKMAGGDVAPEPGLTVEWAGGFPTSPAPRFLNCCGTYQGKPNANKTGQLIAIPLGGGPRTTTVLSLSKEGWSDDPPLKLPTGGRDYSVIGVVNDGGPNGGLTYCTSYCQTYVQP